MKTTYVHSTRHNGDDEEQVMILRTGLHRYSGQGEMAIFARPISGGRGRWYVGYGGDYIPANRGDLDNIELV